MSKPKSDTIQKFAKAALQYAADPEKNTFEIELEDEESEVFREWLKSCPTINLCNCPKCQAEEKQNHE